MSRRQVSYNVSPRWTCGSPAMVHDYVAERVAEQERRAHVPAQHGLYGEVTQALAMEEHALSGIAYALTETRQGWRVFDLITEEEREVPTAVWRLEKALVDEGFSYTVARSVTSAVAKVRGRKLKEHQAREIAEEFKRFHDLWAAEADRRGLSPEGVQEKALEELLVAVR